MKPSAHATLLQFMKAQFSAMAATGIDLITTALLFRLAGFSPFWSTVVGAACGGIVNCITNYHWTFPGTGRSRQGIAIRYFIVWGGSILLNAWGVKLAVTLLSRHPETTLPELMLARIFVAVLVAILWNFNLQKRWVYKIGESSSQSSLGIPKDDA